MLSDDIKKYRPCQKAVTWLDQQKDWTTAWQTCERPEWMLWLLGKIDADKKLIVRVACDIARTVVHLAQGPEAMNAILAAEGWTEGKVSIGDVQKAAAAAAWAAAGAADAARAAIDLAALLRQAIAETEGK